MIDMYCGHHHKGKEQSQKRCNDCQKLYEYALNKIEKCVFGLDKPVCSSCTRHCYQTDQREQIRKVMRYAGPRMLYRHPILAGYYFINKHKSRRNRAK